MELYQSIYYIVKAWRETVVDVAHEVAALALALCHRLFVIFNKPYYYY